MAKFDLDDLIRGFVGSDDEDLFKDRPLFEVSTGSYALNDALHTEGLLGGRIIQYYGPSASGKTMMALLAVKEAQKLDPESLQIYIDAEATYDKTWAGKLGVDTSRLKLIKDEHAVYSDQLFEILIGRPKMDAKTRLYAGKEKEGLLDKIKNKDANINLIVLDSLGQLISPIESTAVVGKQNMAATARFLTTEMKRLSLAVAKANIPFIIINHKRDNMDPYGSDHTYAGGNAYTHSLSANVYFRQKGSKEDQIFSDEKKTLKIGATIVATVEKSKFGPHPRTAEFRVNFETGIIDQHMELADLGIKYEIIKRLTPITYCFEGDEIKSQNGVYEYFKDVEKQKQLWALIKANKGQTVCSEVSKSEEELTSAESVIADLTKPRGRKKG